jgi:hypothetical protein
MTQAVLQMIKPNEAAQFGRSRRRCNWKQNESRYGIEIGGWMGGGGPGWKGSINQVEEGTGKS